MNQFLDNRNLGLVRWWRKIKRYVIQIATAITIRYRKLLIENDKHDNPNWLNNQCVIDDCYTTSPDIFENQHKITKSQLRSL